MRFGFENWEEVEKYLGIRFDTNDEDEIEGKQKNNDTYDYVLIDIDSYKKFLDFDALEADKNYFVTSFDMFSLNKGIKIFQNLRTPIKLTKILFSYDSGTKQEEEYLNTMSLGYKIQWSDFVLCFQILSEDNKALQENQRLEKIRFKRLSANYRDCLAYIVQYITGIDNFSKIKKMMKE